MMRQNQKTGRSKYLFSAALASAALAGIPAINGRVYAAPLVTNADFTFESAATMSGYNGSPSSNPLSSSVSGPTAGMFGTLIAEVGTGSAYGSHAAGSSAVYSSPSGNGSTHSFSSNDWAQNDYYQFNVPTTGIQNIVFSFDQIGSNTGPADFQVQYSTDGTNFLSFSNYTINTSAGTSSGWTPATSLAAYNYSFNLAGITGLNNDANALFRIVDNGTTSLNGGSVATGGTDRVDNVIVAGNSVPEPASLSLLSIAGASLVARRRRHR
jgi:PEP-CTERM motif-containing protein